MADLSQLPKGIPRKIALDHLETLEDADNFKQVCSLWNSESSDIDPAKTVCPSSNIQLPWLMLADSPTSNYRRFYSLPKGMYRKIDLPRFDTDSDDYRRCFSSQGWLIFVSRRQRIITFYDPFSPTDTVINPPTMPLFEFYDGDRWDDNSYSYQFHKFIFSTDGRRSCNDMQVVMIFNANRSIAFWRPGQQHWIRPVVVQDFNPCQIDDVCFFRGLFYSIDNYDRVISFGNPPRILVDLHSEGLVTNVSTKYYIAPLSASLLVVSRSVYCDDSELYWTQSFKLFEVNVETGKASRVHDIGNKALFVGQNSTFFVEASPLHKHVCRPNCIYFTDDNTEFYDPNNSPSRGGGVDMGIYSLEEDKVVDRIYEGPSQFSYETPPLWIELPHH